MEYFTKRGRPLTKEEIYRLMEEDRRQRDDEEHKRRTEEEAERRRVARLMEDLEDNQDYETFELQQKAAADTAFLGGAGASSLANQKESRGKKLNFDLPNS